MYVMEYLIYHLRYSCSCNHDDDDYDYDDDGDDVNDAVLTVSMTMTTIVLLGPYWHDWHYNQYIRNDRRNNGGPLRQKETKNFVSNLTKNKG